MKKLLIIFSSFITLTCLLGLALVIYVSNIDPNKHKDWIDQQFFNATGRNLSINGNIDLSFYPWFGLELNDIAISNPQGFSNTTFLTSEEVSLRVKLMPMLEKRYEIDTVILNTTHINLEKNAAGEPNWIFQNSEEQSRTQDETPQANLPLSNIALGGVAIQDASLSFNNQATGQQIDITSLAVTTGELLYGEPIELNLGFNARANQPVLEAETSLQGTMLYDLEQQHYEFTPLTINSLISSPNIPEGSANLSLMTGLNVDLKKQELSLENFTIDLLGTQVNANLTVHQIQTDTPAVEADISIEGEDLAVLFRLAEINDLAQQIENIPGRQFTFKTQLAADYLSGSVNLSEFEAKLLGASISGIINASKIQTESPIIAAQLQALGPNLPTLLGIAGQILGGDESSLSVYSRQLSSITNKAFSIDANFSANLEAGDIELPTFNADLLGLSLTAQLNAEDIHNDSGTITGDLNLHGDNLGEILTALGQDGLGEVAKSMDLSMTMDGNRDTLDINPLSLSVTLDSPQISNSPTTMELLANSNFSLERDTLAVNELSLQGLGVNTTGHLELNNISTNTSFNGNLAIAPFNLRQLLKQLNQDLPPTSDNSVLQRVSATLDFIGTTNDIKLNSFSGSLDDSAFSGSLAVREFDNPAIEFALDLDQINADRYLYPASSNRSNKSSADSSSTIDSLKNLDLKGSINTGQLQISNLSFSDIEIGINAKAGQINLSPMQANLYQGSYSGDINLDVSNIPQAKLNMALTDITIAPALNDFMNASYVSGVGSLKLSLSGSGSDITDIKRNLNGSGTIALTDGHFEGVDVGSVLSQIETMIRSRRLLDINRGSATAFDSFNATLGINNGNITSNDLVILSPGFQVKGQGSLVNLNNDSINYKLLTSVDPSTATTNDEEYDIGGYTLPIACTGNIDSPSCLPDTQEILASALQQGLSNLLQRALGTEPDNGAESSSEDQPTNPRDELINRALERLLR